MTDDRAMNGEEKLLMVSRQLDSMDQVGQFDLECPYCGSYTSPGKAFCCPTVTRAVEVLLEAKDKFGRKQVARHLN